MPHLAMPVPPPAITAHAAVLIDGDSGQVLFARNAHLRLPPASTTKLMTALIASEGGRLEEVFTISTHSTEIKGSSLYLEPGERLTLEQLLFGLLLKSGNDAADAIATNFAGSTDRFVLLMNERATALGMVDTQFTNPHGLPDPNHYSSAYDLASLGRIALDNLVVQRVSATKAREIQGNSRTKFVPRRLLNHNKLLGKFPGALGGKTGYTATAGRCFVGGAKWKGRYVIEAILASPRLWQDAAALFNYGIYGFNTAQVAAPGTNFGTVPVTGGSDIVVRATLVEAARVALPVGQSPKSLIQRVNLRGDVKAPVQIGDRLGSLHVSLGGKEIATIPLVAASPVARGQSLVRRILSIVGWFTAGGLLAMGVWAVLRPRHPKHDGPSKSGHGRAGTKKSAVRVAVERRHAFLPSGARGGR